MWIVKWLRPNIPKWNKAYFTRESEARRFYRVKSYNNGMEVKISFHPEFELQEWEK
jgi:hypothetical protein